MEFLRYILRFFYRIRWYLILLPMIAVIIAWFLTRKEDKLYNVETTIYTGIISGYSLEGSVSQNSATNMANLLLIITTEKTIKRVSLRLLARCLMYGDPEHDNNYIFAEHYRDLKNSAPKEVLALVDKRSESRTVDNLTAYAAPKSDNFVYQILSHHIYFGIPDISSRLKVVQLGNSDMIQIGYSANDAGIAYNTLEILNEEFINQYQAIRFGETNNVIKFFENEVNRLYRILCGAEDDLIAYNVSKRVINYFEQTKQIAIMDANHKTRENDQLLARMSQRSVIDWLENQLGNQVSNVKNNEDFLQSLSVISRLKSRISNLELMAEENDENAQEVIADARKELAEAEEHTRAIVNAIAGENNSISGIKKQTLLSQWLTEILKQEETSAQMQAMDIMRTKLQNEFLYFSPIGATLGRKERHIGFIEANYMEMLKALNAARLRQRNLQLTTATLRVLNPPMFPLNSAPSNRLMILIMTFIVTFALVAAFFYLVEMLDRTLRDRMRTEKITKTPVMGCYPKESNLRYRKYNKVINDMALRQLSKSLLPYLDTEHKNVINLLSTSEGNGKSYIANELDDLWTSLGLQVRRLTYDEDFLTDDKKYIMAKSIEDLCPDLTNNEVLIVEYPSLDEHEVPTELINEGTVNLLVTRANRTWKDIDQKALNQLNSVLQKKDTLFFYLTEAGRNAVEEYVGQLPPYTPFKNFVYRMSQMGLTATENNNRK